MSARQTKRGAARKKATTNHLERKRANLQAKLKATPANAKKKTLSRSTRAASRIEKSVQWFVKNYLEEQEKWAETLEEALGKINSFRAFTYDGENNKIIAFEVQRLKKEPDKPLLVSVYECMTWEEFQEKWTTGKTKEIKTLESQKLALTDSTDKILDPAYVETLGVEDRRKLALQRSEDGKALITSITRNVNYLPQTLMADKYSFVVAKNHFRCREVCRRCGKPQAPRPVTDSGPMSLDEDDGQTGDEGGLPEGSKTFQDYRLTDPLVRDLWLAYKASLELSEKLETLRTQIAHPWVQGPSFEFREIQDAEAGVSFCEIKRKGLCLRVPTLTRTKESITLAFPSKNLTLMGYPNTSGHRSYSVRQWMWNQARWAVSETIQHTDEPKLVDYATVHFDDSFWNIGGRNADNDVVNIVQGWKYFTSERKFIDWDAENQELEYPVDMHAAAIVGNKLIVTGGRDQKENSVAHTQHFKFAYRNVGKNTKTIPAVVRDKPHHSTLQQARSRHASVVWKNQVFVVGGVQELNNQKPRYWGSLEVLEHQAWRLQYEEMFTARAEFAAVVFGDKLYVMGGYNSENGILNSVESYDFKQKFWDQEPKMNFGRRGGRAVVWNGRIFVFGGHRIGDPFDDGNVVHTVESFRPGDGEWIQEKQYYFHNQNTEICVASLGLEERYLAYE